MRKLIYLLLLLTINASSQTYDLSGKWNGTIQDGDKKSYFTLNLKLTDSCNLIYFVTQFQNKKFECSYMMNQSSNNILVRDAIGFWKDSDDDGNIAHITLKYKSNKLEGYRMGFDESKEKITLKRSTSLSFIQPCQNIQTNVPCANAIPVSIPQEVVLVEDSSIVSIGIIDTDVNDSDLVSLFFGNHRILNNMPIYNSNMYTIPLMITQDTVITWCACNQGKSGKNTGELRVIEYFQNGKFETESKIPIQLNTNNQAAILIHVRNKLTLKQ